MVVHFLASVCHSVPLVEAVRWLMVRFSVGWPSPAGPVFATFRGPPFTGGARPLSASRSPASEESEKQSEEHEEQEDLEEEPQHNERGSHETGHRFCSTEHGCSDQNAKSNY